MKENPEFNKSIICVDDEESVLTSYRNVLINSPSETMFSEILGNDREEIGSVSREAHNYKLFLASSGEEAIRIVEEEKSRGNHIAAGFFDMRMPGGMDGYEAIKRIREIDPQILCAVMVIKSESTSFCLYGDLDVLLLG